MKKVMVFGTFDGVHEGHRDLFRQARAYGDYLIVAIARDVNVKKTKGRRPKFSENRRLKDLKAEKLVDQAVLGYEHNYYRIIKEHRPDVICIGYDQKVDIPALKKQLADWKMDQVEIHRLASFYPEKYKSSLLNK